MTYFIFSVFLLLITPGPGVLSTAGVGAAFGRRAGIRYLIGLFIGTNLVALAVVSGVSVIVFSIPWLRQLLLLCSALYLLLLAFRIATSGSKIGFIDTQKDPGIVAGIILQTINPKAYVVNTTLFSGYAFMADNLLLETIVKFIIINAIWIPIHLLWLTAGIKLKSLALSAKTQRSINVIMASSMLAVVALALLSSSQSS
ncbi:lysine transporter LysE [Chromatiales bacterium (ex Bugula neritina AB1)]|nr:lysine transporter LysE [Chromatiales bacterium (ex Bugula neritina AB1)]